MPAAAWLFLLAAMGLGLLAAGGADSDASKAPLARRLVPVGRIAAALGIAAIYWRHQEPRMRDQIWFFGRASRNIFDQQLTAGYLLERLDVKRVLVGDAGALLYASDRSGIDLIGLGGFHRYPFARSTLNGLGAAIEQLEKIPVDERPDAMALYPSWWGDLPVHFGRFVTAVPVTGNVICGGAEKVIYRADWSPLDRDGTPRTLAPNERVVDELDIADLDSERTHAFDLPRPSLGFVQYRVLADAGRRDHDLFDAGRLLPGGVSASANVELPRAGARLIVRLAPDHATTLEVRIDGNAVGRLVVEPSPGQWVEAALELPPGTAAKGRLELSAVDSDVVVYHAWLVDSR
jgi:hypothetical protein